MSTYYQDPQVTLHLGDALDVLRTLPDESVDCIVSSPPYFGLRDYGVAGQYGLESSPAEYVETLRAVFCEARRVLAKDGTCWINLGDVWIGKELQLLPEQVALALRTDGWLLRNSITWHKPNPIPDPTAHDRLARSHEQVFLLAKSPRYWFDLDAIREPYQPDSLERRSKYGRHVPGGYAPGDRKDAGRGGPMGFGGAVEAHPLGRNPGDVWKIAPKPFPGAHFAVMAPALAQRCVKAGCRPGGTVLDLFSGSGTTGAAARQLGRRYVGIEINPAYHDLAVKRFQQGVLDFEGSGEAA
jgi:site-specific DNA-methyltransferase (cytosine-N4-specific)